MPDKDFSLELRYVKDEKSKDSHTVTYTVRVSAASVDASYSYAGYPDDRSETVSYSLSPEGLERLKDAIRTLGLAIDHREEHPMSGTGLSVSAEMTLTQDGRRHRIRSSGMLREWGVSEEKQSNIERRDIVDNLWSLVDGLYRKSGV